MSLNINVLGYKKFVQVSSELRVHKKGYKKLKVSFWKIFILFVSVAPQYGITSQYSSYFFKNFTKQYFINIKKANPSKYFNSIIFSVHGSSIIFFEKILKNWID